MAFFKTLARQGFEEGERPAVPDGKVTLVSGLCKIRQNGKVLRLKKTNF
jgi:hypothetical protein